MFAKTMFQYQLTSQGEILSQIAALVDTGKIKSTENFVLRGFTTENIHHAHSLLESGKSAGKIVIDFR
jgi:NADPH2:quinone reductase